jgi:alpha-L-rhamnosidase
VNNPKPGVYVYDFGENISGRVRLTVSGPEGSEIIIRYGERLFEDGTLNQQELSRFVFSGETQTSRYILGRNQPSNWSPSFTYHGFQYAEVTVPEGVTIHDLKAEVLHTDFETVGSFTSSNTLLNKIHKAFKNSYLGNYHGYPTDCPHREKIGWSGDAHLVAEAGLYNFDSVTSYLKWIDDFVDEQRATGQIPGIIPTSGWGYTFGDEQNPHYNRGYGPQWEAAFVLIPWQMYQHTGDLSILKRYYQPLKKYLLYLESHADPDFTLSFGINDHKALTNTGPEILSSGYFYNLSNIFSEMAAELGVQEDEYYFENLSEKIREGYRNRFYDEDTDEWGNGSQTSLAGTLYHGLADSSEVEEILAQLLKDLQDNDYHLDTGVVGTKYMMHVLTRYGHAEVMYQIASKRSFPSWGYWIEQGATTLWQNWDGSQSRNHVMFGSIDEWFYNTLAGIRPDPSQPGFKRVIIRPAFIDELDWVEGSYLSQRGLIESKWKRNENSLELSVSIPANSNAQIHLPTENANQIYENGISITEASAVQILHTENDRTVVETGSGEYHFRIELKPN